MNVREIVTNTLSAEGKGAYVREAEGVINAVADAIEERVHAVITIATSRGLARTDAVAVLTEAGLITPDPEPAAAPTDALEATLSRIEQALASTTSVLSGLTDFARRHGYAGR